MQKFARFTVRRRWWIVATWIVLVVAVEGIAGAAGGATYKDVFTLPHTQTQKVLDLLKSHGGAAQTGLTGTVVIRPTRGTLGTTAPPGLEAALSGLCTAGLHISGTTSPWGQTSCDGAPVRAVPVTGHNPLLSADNTLGLVIISWQNNQNAVGNFVGAHDRLDKLSSAQYEYEFTGDAFAALQQAQKGVPPELVGFIAAFIILGFVFRAVIPMLAPIISAIAALGVGLGLIALLTHALNVASFASELATLMVIGVGVDYALFIVTRHRRNLLRGVTIEESIVVALDTSGRAVLFAGATVFVAILGLCALGASFLYGVAIGTSIAVALTVIASLTLLPAVLAISGYRVLPRRVRAAVKAGAYQVDETPTRWARWADLVTNHKAALSGLAGLLIVVVAIPFFSLRLGHADQSNDPTSSTTRKGYDLIAHAKGFGPGYNSTLEVVVSGPTATSAATLQAVTQRLASVPDVNAASIRPVPVSSDLVLVSFKSITSPQDIRTTQLVSHLRGPIARELQSGTPNQVYVFGQTAIFVDFAHVLAAKMPLFFATIVGLSFLLLMVAFRSVVIPLTAALMNVLAAGASFGVVVAIFQWGWLSEALGIGSGGPIEAFVPVMFFAILFGLSMDYQVFLVSRMHEEWTHTHDNRRAISVGQAETGGIITAAALIMIAVFGGFVLGDFRVIKMFGIGLGGAIFIDAFIVRTVLVPALMHLLGNRNWYYPAWLDRITPHVSVAHPDEQEVGESPTDAYAQA